MIRTHHCSPSTPLTPGTSGRNYNATNRPKFKHNFLRPRRRGRPYSLPTFILILWPPRSIYSYSPRVWNHLPRSHLLFWKKRTIWIYGNSMGYNIHRLLRVHCMSASYIHSRVRRRHTSLLYIRHNNHCHPHRR